MSAPRSSSRRHAGLILVIASVLIGVLVAAMDARRATDILHDASWRWVPVAIVLTLVSYACLSASFSLVNRIFGITLRQRDQMEIGFVAFALNNLVSVAGLAGYSLRVFLLRRRGMATGDVLGASIAHTYLNQVALMSLLPAGLVYLLINHPLGETATVELAIVAALSLALLAGATVLLVHNRARARAARVLAWTGRRLLRRSVDAGVDRLEQTIGRGISTIRQRPAVLAAPLALVAVDWATSVLALGACFEALRSPLHPGVLLTGFSIGVTAGMLSMLPGGIGVQEGSMAGVFVLLGVGYERAVLAAILFRVLYYLVPFGLSLLLYAHLLRGRRPETAVRS